ncbi:carboxymuconolactone decarboxylase family protein [Lentzea sp. BCCO 10_0798]|uniref:Carboxymuconolactone decarboxylase family protein n=1 Tax=Lentzea kristufekii TaxID=3095430 RepID=A0ABU4U7Z4_9PSEU|nr:carboxymuconolactone decarboxylase family protein [Lentzea sp. BCCO 10_0798]MDX8056475.1 carboxymuconolactone decarboxylase family protein [Lentzea sp. BCCO 10_0798]
MSGIVKHVDVVPAKRATGLVREVYTQSTKEVGRLVEAVTMFSAAPELLAASWAAFREPLLAGAASRVSKEAVAATVSRLNQCTYCVDAHAIMLYGGGAGSFATQLLSGGSGGELDANLRPFATWAEMPARPPFPAAHTPEYVGVLVYFHFLNRVINVLLDGTFLPGPPRAKAIARRVAGKMMAGKVNARNEAGRATGLRSGTAPPEGFGWAAGSPAIASAFSALATETAAAAAHVPDETHHTLDTVVTSRLGEPQGVSAAWVDEHLRPLGRKSVPSARLALLTALAPHQVSDRDVVQFREQQPEDLDLLGLLSLAALTAARHLGERKAAAVH